MKRYVYTVIESLSGTFYGTLTSKKSVKDRIRELAESRKTQAEKHGKSVEARENWFTRVHETDPVVTLLVSHDNSDIDEKFTVYRSVIQTCLK